MKVAEVAVIHKETTEAVKMTTLKRDRFVEGHGTWHGNNDKANGKWEGPRAN